MLELLKCLGFAVGLPAALVLPALIARMRGWGD